MKMRRRAKLLKLRLQARVKYYATEEELFDAVRASLAREAERALGPTQFRKFGEQKSFAEAINAMSDADLDRALEEGKSNGLYETFRRLKQ